MNSSWLSNMDKAAISAKRDDKSFDNLPPLETIHPDELKNYSRQQLRWYLEQRGLYIFFFEAFRRVP